MIEKSRPQKKKCTISEDDISSLLQRYPANTVLALLQEVAQFDGVKIDWNVLVKRTKTGICNAREYQMLWRHLAYRHDLLEPLELEDRYNVLDDDSDLECELEAFPDVGVEALSEASACVKVLIASGIPSDSTHLNSTKVEAPLTINVPNGQSKAPLENSQLATMRGINIAVPVSVQKQPLHTVTSIEGLDANGSAGGNFPPRRKRKPWSEAEDLALIAAVQKYGEGNWKTIVGSELKWDRTATQLSQRWAIIRKKHGNWNTVGSTSGVQLSEAQRAARHAMNLALDPPVRNIFTNNSGEVVSSQLQSQQPIVPKSSSIPLSSVTKSQQAVKKPAIPDSNSDPVRAAAVAAGARIATQSDAASLLKAAQAKNAVHIMPSGGSSIKTSLSGGTSNPSEAHPSAHINDLPAESRSTLSVVSTSGSLSVALPITQHIASISETSTNLPAKQSNPELLSEKDATTAGRIKTSSEDLVGQQVGENGACLSGNNTSKQVQDQKPALTSHQLQAESKTQMAIAESSSALSKLETAKSDTQDVLSERADGIQTHNVDKVISVAKDENQSGIQVTGDSQCRSDKPDTTAMEVDK